MTAENSLQERFQKWADELVDLSANNELINFKVTKTSTRLPDRKGLSKLLSGDTVASNDLFQKFSQATTWLDGVYARVTE